MLLKTFLTKNGKCLYGFHASVMPCIIVVANH